MRKYRNVPTIVNSIRFASKREAKRYGELLLLVKAGKIHTLNLQPRYPLVVNDAKIATYVADFSYYEMGKQIDWLVVEDSKGMRTPEYKLKKKLFEALYPYKITEV